MNFVSAKIWAADVEKVVAHVVATGGELPPAHSALRRASDVAGLSVCCLPCVAWSTVMRIVACPFMCLCKGPAFMCSNNGCTDPSDACISAAVDAAGAEYDISTKAPIVATKDDGELVVAALRRIDGVYSPSNMRVFYAIHGATRAAVAYLAKATNDIRVVGLAAAKASVEKAIAEVTAVQGSRAADDDI
jgi:hypothetical protein